MRHRSDQGLAQCVRLLAHLGLAHVWSPVARHHGDEDEQNEIDDMNRVVNAEIVDRRIEEECRRADAGQRRNHGRNDAAADCGEQDRDQVDDRDVLDIDER